MRSITYCLAPKFDSACNIKSCIWRRIPDADITVFLHNPKRISHRHRVPDHEMALHTELPARTCIPNADIAGRVISVRPVQREWRGPGITLRSRVSCESLRPLRSSRTYRARIALRSGVAFGTLRTRRAHRTCVTLRSGVARESLRSLLTRPT